jgi:hypothetical protein
LAHVVVSVHPEDPAGQHWSLLVDLKHSALTRLCAISDHAKRHVFTELASGLNHFGYDKFARSGTCVPTSALCVCQAGLILFSIVAGLSGYFLTPGAYVIEIFIGPYYSHGLGAGLSGTTSACVPLLAMELSVRQFRDSTFNNPDQLSPRLLALTQALPDETHAWSGDDQAHGKAHRAPTSNERDMLMFIVCSLLDSMVIVYLFTMCIFVCSLRVRLKVCPSRTPMLLIPTSRLHWRTAMSLPESSTDPRKIWATNALSTSR